ncbi:MAG TPA: poly-gamma-glutamate hydrolase family protein [Acidimicrobiales bacterium]|nr:poly-gamma-glutamate hydrolase family protein [Acidimicrobiales bacterium]
MFEELLAHPGVEEVCELRSTFGVMAFHGGNLEKATDTIATRVAEEAGASLYAVLQPSDLRWHIPSTSVQPSASPQLTKFIEHVDVALAVHGYGREGYWTTVLLGGANRDLACHLGDALRTWIGPHGYTVIDALDDIPTALRGVHPRNPVNLPPSKGVQLELPPRVRGTTPLSKPEYTEALIEGLVTAVTSWDSGRVGEGSASDEPTARTSDP